MSNDDDSISDPDSASFTLDATEARSDDDDDPPSNPPSGASSASSSSYSSSSTSRSPSNNDSVQSGNTHIKARSEINSEEQNVRSDDDNNENVDDTSVQLRRNIEKVRSEINPHNILQSKRTRKQNKEPNIESLGGQKYHPEFLSLSDKASTPSKGELLYSYEQQKRNLLQRTIGVCFNQMTAKRGIKLYGEKAIAAIFKEYKQLKDLEVLGRICPD